MTTTDQAAPASLDTALAGSRPVSEAQNGLVPARRRLGWAWVRRAALAVYFTVLIWSCITVGLPVADDRLFAFTVVGLLCASIGRPRRQLRDLVVDWGPFILVVIAYDYSRGWAQHAGFGVHFVPQIRADELLFWGHVPTVWLQEHLYQAVRHGPVASPLGPVRWWEVAFQVVYISHFIASFTFAAVLWVRKRAGFQAYARRLVTLSYCGFVTYVLFPAAPPWLAAVEGHLPAEIGRMGRGLDVIGLRVVGDLITEGAKTQNQVAAIPSLHLGFAALIVITLWRMVAPRWRPLLAAYSLAMSCVLVVTGEHYVIDLILGFAYALGVHVAWTHIERWWSGRQRRRLESPPLLPSEATPG